MFFCVWIFTYLNMCVFGLTQCENLPKKNAVWPHIAQGGVQIMENTFWCHPLQGQEGLNERKQCSMWENEELFWNIRQWTGLRVQFAVICYNCRSTIAFWLSYIHYITFIWQLLLFKVTFFKFIQTCGKIARCQQKIGITSLASVCFF